MHRRYQCIIGIQLPLLQTSVYNLDVLFINHWFDNKAAVMLHNIKMPPCNWDNPTICKEKEEGGEKAV